MHRFAPKLSAARSWLLNSTLCGSLAYLCGPGVVAAQNDPEPPDRIDFATDVQPLLRRHCYRCHGQQSQEGDLQLHRRETALGTAASASPVILPGNPHESLLIQRVSDPSYGKLMPRDGVPLAPREIDILSRWIAQGAPWPDALADGRHWAYQPAIRPAVPEVGERSWGVNPVDRFVLRRLQREGLNPSPPVDRARLIRRVTLALIGLAPTRQEVQSFVNDASPDAYEKVVDRLLASERYGERWAVPWLDLARYADSNGFQADQIRDNWAYRDWVIRSFNADMPFDQFVVDQIAGDLRPDATLDQRVATGFHRMTPCNVEAGVHPEANRINQIVDRVNTTATVFLGATIECAQCHDHKYDPFTQRDYYRLFAYFNNTPLEVKHTSGVTWDFYGPTLDLPTRQSTKGRRDRLQSLLADLERQRDAISENGDGKSEIDRQIRQTQMQLENRASDTTLVMVELEEPRQTRVLVRGDYEQPGETVEPGTPSFLPALDARSGTGDRMELAQWLVSPANPLLARVTVNRWWGELFGTGLVSTPEDFGAQGDDPSHPQLLDWLATELVAANWSMKHLHKTIVMSATYRQNAYVSPDLSARDPQNRLLARGPRFRLSAELIRDNALSISGLLSTTMYGPPVMPHQPENIWRSVGRNQPIWKTESGPDRFRRGVYVVWKRAAPYPSFVNFDAPDRSSCTVSRGRTNTPLQALTLLNDPAYVEMALALADRILCESPEASDDGRIGYAIELVLSRPGRLSEVEVFKELLTLERRSLADDSELVAARTTPRFADMRLQTECKPELAAWFAVGNALLNLDETMSP